MRLAKSSVAFRMSFSIVLILSLYGFGPAQDTPTGIPEKGQAHLQSLLRYAIPGTRELQLIVELEDPSVVQMLREATEAGTALPAGAAAVRRRLNLETAQAVAYRGRLNRTQRAVTDRLQGLAAVQVQGATDLVMNSIIVRAPLEQYRAIRRIPGVKRVYFSRPIRKNLNAAAPLQNAPALWARVAGGRSGSGEGVKVGIIDTGIDISHPMFADSTAPTPTTYPSGFPMYDPGNQEFTNHKVIVARDYIGLLSKPQTIQTAADEDGHGSFVAGCAAGKLVSAPLAQISGMAPAALLGNYKVFGTPGINDYTTTAAVVRAINDAVHDGMDVLNLSLGSLDYLPPTEDPEVIAVDNAVAAGLVVSIAAGNEGPDTHTIGTPATAPEALAVGATWNSRVFASQLHVTGPNPVPVDLQNIAYVNGTGPAIPTAIPSTPLLDVAALDGSGLACAALPASSLAGRTAVIQRGSCLFADKVTNSENAGALAVIVFNNVQGGTPIAMAGLESTSIPAVMISNPDGIALRDFIAANPGATVGIDASTEITAVPTIPGVLAQSSSRGPSMDYGIKPDLVAVGRDVYSATQTLFPQQGLYDASQYFTASGTSFSTAMVAGAAAAVIQLFPTLAPAGIKSALVNTADQSVTLDGVSPGTVVQAGAGLLDMGNAAAAAAVFSPIHLNFGVHSFTDSISLIQTFTIRNISAGSDRYTVSVDPVVDGPSVLLTPTDTGQIAAGSETTIQVAVAATAPLTGGFQGFIRIQGTQTSTSYAIPYWAGLYVPDSSRVLTVSQTAVGSDGFDNLTDAIAAANPGNVIEIADSGTYTLPRPSESSLPSVTISTNAQGLPLHGLTIRAASGAAPVLDGTSSSSFSDLAIIGLRDVLIQGLTIQGGETGIEVWQPSASVPTSVTIDHCMLINQAESSTSGGVFVENGGDVGITYSTISGSSGTGLFVMGGARLTISNSEIQNNGYDGIDVFDSNVMVLQSTIGHNAGTGLYLENCTGTLQKSTFEANTGVFGDGIEVGDGRLTVVENAFTNNDSAGIYTFAASGSGPRMRIEGNRIQSNGDYGIQSDNALNLQVERNLIADNGLGFRARGTTAAVLIDNLILRSTGASQGNGVDVGSVSSVRLTNNTIYGNRLHGITLGSFASLSVINTIISQSTAGDLQGISAGNIQSSLIGDGTLATGSNIAGDPGFVDPNGSDFQLAPGSPAINAGSNTAADLPLLDYNGKLRVAAAGALPGKGNVDMGAMESDSSYPISYPLLLSGVDAGMGDSFITGFATLDPADTAAQANFVAYDDAGNPLSGTSNPATLPLTPNAQVAALDFELFGFARGESRLGAVLGASMQKLVGFFLIFDEAFTRLADGVDVSADSWTDFYFPRHRSDSSGQATYQLFNPGINPANIVATLVNSSGANLDIKTATIPSMGQQRLTFNTLTASSGYVHVNSDRPLTGLEVFGNASEIAALRAAPAGTDTLLYFPHIAVNEGYSSFVGVLNSSGLPANLTLTAYANDGSTMGEPAYRSIQSGGQLLESATNLFGLAPGNLWTGYVTAASDQPGILGFSEFDYDSGNVHASAAVPSTAVPQQKLLFSHVAHQVPAGSGVDYLTGIALLNPFGTPVSYTLKVFDGGGSKVAETTGELGPHAKVARLLSHPTAGAGYFTQPLPLGGGHIEVTTDYQILGFELFFTQDLTQIAAVMAQIG